MATEKDSIPKVGDQVYIDTSLYVTHGIDDFIGGLCEVDDNQRGHLKPDFRKEFNEL